MRSTEGGTWLATEGRFWGCISFTYYEPRQRPRFRHQSSRPQLSVRRFRPNIIFTGPEAYSEDSWKRIKIGGADYHVSCRTVRCLLPNVDPITGERHPSEPNRTLKSFRRIDEGDIKNACIGMQMVPAGAESQIKVGDVIEVLETGDHYYIRQ